VSLSDRQHRAAAVRSSNPISPETTAWLANVRAELATGALPVTVNGPASSVAIFPDEIVGKSDDELLAFIAGRLAEQ
jgi:hypothetical protein